MTAIKFVRSFAGKRVYITVTHSQLDEWTYDEFIKNGLYESLKNREYVRLYFDFDFHEDENIVELVDEIINGLGEMMDVFGEYHYAGYCTDTSIHEQLGEFAQYIELKSENLGKPLSFHVVFPNTMMLQDELCDIMKKDSNYDFPLKKFIDVNVYKETKKEQLLRHPYAHKYGAKEYVNKGVDFTKLSQHPRPSDLVATPCGTEKIIDKSQWSTVFRMDVDDDEQVDIPDDEMSAIVDRLIDTIDDKGDDDISPEDIPTTDAISSEMFKLLYQGYAKLTIHGDVGDVTKEISLFPLMSGMYECIGENVTVDDVDDALDFIKDNANLTPEARAKWSEKRKQARNNNECRGPGVLFLYLKYHKPNYYNTHIRPLIVKKMDVNSVKFDLQDPFSISDIMQKGDNREYQVNGNPEKLDYNAVLCDLKRVFVVVGKGSGIYYFKSRNERTGTNEFDITNRKDAKDKLTDIHVGTEARGKRKQIATVSAYDVFNAGSNNKQFQRNDVCFYSENPDVVSYYQGLKYQPVQNDELIKLFNDHIRNVICKGNDELYNYLQSWFATIVQNPLAKTTTALIIKGNEGTGKNTVTDVWCELLRGYANSNADIDAFAGKYNTGIANTKLAVFNEVVSAELANKTLFSSLKKLITESEYVLHAKHRNAMPAQQNVLNMIFLSNEFNPIMISSTDRRYVVLTPSEQHRNDSAYFKPLYASIKMGGRGSGYRADFMQALMYYYQNYDVTIDLTRIPETEEKMLLQETNKSAIESFVEDRCLELADDGMDVAYAFEEFKHFVISNGFKYQLKKQTFSSEMTRFCKMNKNGKYLQPVQGKNGRRVYKFTDEMKQRYADLIKMRQNDEYGWDRMDVCDDDIPVRGTVEPDDSVESIEQQIALLQQKLASKKMSSK